MAIEVKIYNQDSRLPEFISVQGDRLHIAGAKEGKPGPYNRVYDFGHSQEPLRAIVPLEERVTKNTKTVIWGEFKHPSIGESMRRITRINRDNPPENNFPRTAYQFEVYETFRKMKPAIRKSLKGATVFFPPKNGGALVRAMFQELELIEDSEEQVVDYELKRVLGADDRLMVGVIHGSYPEGNFETVCFADDCLASMVSAWASADLAREHYPKADNFVGVVAAGAQRGVMAMDQELEQHFRFPQHTFNAGALVLQMSSNYYLERTENEGFEPGTQFVGDMGKWARSLPSSLNEIAPWNRWR